MIGRIVLAVVFSLFLAACSTGPRPAPAPPAFESPLANQIAPQAETDATPAATSKDAVQVIIVPSEIVAGPNRFAVGIIDSSGMVKDAAVRFRYFDLTDPNKPVLESEADAVRLQTPDGATVIYAQERDFARAGHWGVEVQARYPDGKLISKQVGFEVLAKSPTLKVGDRVPAIDTPTAASVGNDLHKLTSSDKPNAAFYRMSLAQALADGKPTVFVLATPAFCTSRLCGPAYDTETELQQRYGDKLNFISIEVFAGLPNPAANNWQLTPAMQAFGLQTEPWLFLISRNGQVAYRVEGLFTTDEVDRHIQAVLQ